MGRGRCCCGARGMRPPPPPYSVRASPLPLPLPRAAFPRSEPDEVCSLLQEESLRESQRSRLAHPRGGLGRAAPRAAALWRRRWQGAPAHWESREEPAAKEEAQTQRRRGPVSRGAETLFRPALPSLTLACWLQECAEELQAVPDRTRAVPALESARPPAAEDREPPVPSRTLCSFRLSAICGFGRRTVRKSRLRSSERWRRADG